jgi:hypothetical protein
MTDEVKIPGWLMGIIGSVAGAAIIGLTGAVWGMSGKVERLEATQVHLIKQIDRTLDAITDLEDDIDELD